MTQDKDLPLSTKILRWWAVWFVIVVFSVMGVLMMIDYANSLFSFL